MTPLYPLITKHIRLFFAISALFLIPGIISLALFRLKPSIDFTGGSLLEIQGGNNQAKDFTLELLKEKAPTDVHPTSVQVVNEKNVLVRGNPIDAKQKDAWIGNLRSVDTNLHEVSFETVGPTLGKELVVKTAVGLFVALLLITIYLAFRFPDVTFGICAALAAIHDGILVLGVFSILGKLAGVEVDVLFVTALLTIIAFSLHDTLIVYDRIRELMLRSVNATFEEIVNRAVYETLNRSLRNSLAILLMLFVFFILGGETIRWFIFALFVGTLTGTYSSTFVALPLLVIWKRRFGKK